VIDVLGGLAASSPSPHPLPGALKHFEPTLRHYGYYAIAVSLFVENVGIPLPGQLVLIAGAVYAGYGGLNIVAVGLVGLLAAIAGSAAGYVVGVYGGRPLLERYGKYVLLTAERLDKAETFFNRRGWLVLLAGRFVEGVRQAMAILAGISEMTFQRFIVFTSAGALIWVAFWTALSDAAGSHITTIITYAGYFAAAAGLVVIALVVRWVVRARRRTASPPQSSPEPQE
jgi:membrane protein DedA with SNARE-associated domain